MDTLTAARRFFGDLVAASAGASDRRIADVFAKVPREAFLGPGPWLTYVGDSDEAIATPSADPVLLYQDRIFALLPEKHLNNGEPSLHARCLSAITPRPGERVLQVGAGGGYYTAILAELVGPKGRVAAREVEPAMIAAATRNLAGYANVEVVGRSGIEPPLPESDIIYAFTGATRVIRAWLDALADRGRLIFPLTPHWDRGGMLMITRHGENFAARIVSQVWCIPCVGGQDPAEADALRTAFGGGGEGNVKSLRLAPSRPDETCWLAGNGWWLSTAEA
jgi:protein-L-isoaspartate(D-aspartate) O-methyltransferase